jgi:hypothetical protein
VEARHPLLHKLRRNRGDKGGDGGGGGGGGDDDVYKDELVFLFIYLFIFSSKRPLVFRAMSCRYALLHKLRRNRGDKGGGDDDDDDDDDVDAGHDDDGDDSDDDDDDYHHHHHHHIDSTYPERADGEAAVECLGLLELHGVGQHHPHHTMMDIVVVDDNDDDDDDDDDDGPTLSVLTGRRP